MWQDESDNKLLKAMCRTVSQITFESFLLLRMNFYLGDFRRGSKRQADSP